MVVVGVEVNIYLDGWNESPTVDVPFLSEQKHISVVTVKPSTDNGGNNEVEYYNMSILLSIPEYDNSKIYKFKLFFMIDSPHKCPVDSVYDI